MRDLFFYGTLRHRPLLEIVLGVESRVQSTPDSLPDHAVMAVTEGPFPMIEARKGALAEGILVRDLTPDQIARLNFYEGSFAYDLREVVLASGTAAQVYFPQEGQWQGDGPWELAKWQDAWGEMTCHAAREVMGYYGRRTAEEVAAMFPVIRVRAWSRVLAERTVGDAMTTKGHVEVHKTTRCYSNFYAIDEIQLRHSTFDGGWSPQIERGVFYAADAALVLPYDPVRDRVMVIEQFRIGPFARGDQNRWQLEPIAGRLDLGESPETAARREALEEGGLHIGALEKVGETYSSPGNSTEFYYTFVGIADLPDDITGTHGLPEEGEDIRSLLMSFEEFMALCDTQGAANTPLVMAGYWLARHRPRLRLAQGAATP